VNINNLKDGKGRKERLMMKKIMMKDGLKKVIIMKKERIKY
jgi:Fic family protein